MMRSFATSFPRTRGGLATGVMLSLVAVASHATDIRPEVLTVYKTGANGKSRSYVAGLINMNPLMSEPGAGCAHWVGGLKVTAVQFSASGSVVEQFRFKDKRGSTVSVPTNIAALSTAEKSEANHFIREGQSYFAQIQVCGSGGFAELINLYDASSTAGAFE